MSPAKVRAFVAHVVRFQGRKHQFNPWRDHNPGRDCEDAAAIRRRNLRGYLNRRAGTSRLLLCGEACGHSGAAASGIAMTSERILLDLHPTVRAASVYAGGERSSRPGAAGVPNQGYTELTASLVWPLLLGLGVPADDFAIWNALPVHPHQPGDLLSNRTPSDSEVRSGAETLARFISLFPSQAQVVAVGRHAARALDLLGVSYLPVRHPSMGGATEFRRQMREIIARGRRHGDI